MLINNFATSRPALSQRQAEKLYKGAQATLAGVAGAAAGLAWEGAAGVLAHEGGHALTALALYENADPEIVVAPYKSGVTSWSSARLSKVGTWLGPDKAKALVSASGTIVEAGLSMGAFGLGFHLRKENPWLGYGLMSMAAVPILGGVAYASSAIGKDLVSLAASGHDFASLAIKGGISPLASAVILASLLPLEYAVLRTLEARNEPKAPDTLAKSH